ncbi:MAG: hypothetical protein ACRCZK_06170 [Oscillospiraceae bacterium]
MRVTQRSTTRNYMKNLNKNIGNLSKSNDKMSSMRKFDRVSDNTADAARAFKIREQLYKNEQFMANIQDIESELATAESNLMNVNEILKSVKERVLQGYTGTVPEEARDIISREIYNLKEQVLTTMNGKYANKYIFGGSNNDGPPFSTDAAGKLTYNGVVVAEIVNDPITGVPSTSDGNVPPVFTPVPQNKEVYADMGLGLVITGNDIDPKTAIKISTSGLDIMGFGQTTIDGITFENNLYDLLTTIETAFADNDMSEMNAIIEQVDKRSNKFIVNLTDIGSRSQFLVQTAERIENEIFNLKVTQNSLESLNLESEAINNKTFEMAWMVSLQLGSKIIPPSIFDFMR